MTDDIPDGDARSPPGRPPAVSRRRVIGAIAGTGIGVALAGCGGNGGDGNGDGATLAGDDYPDLDRWLTETDVGAADDTYDGTIQDARERSSITVDVGSEGNGGFYAFGPSAVAIAPGTTVTWEWTGEGELHNVEAEPDDQIGASDYEFSSGDPVAEAGTTFEQSFPDTGLALYHCEPHLALGMKGGIVVTEP